MKHDSISAPFGVLEAFMIERFIANRFPEIITEPPTLPKDALARLLFVYQLAIDTLNEAESDIESPEKLCNWVADAEELVNIAISQG